MSPVVLVTGGGSGIGRATVLRFADEGYNCVIADINKDTAEETSNLVKLTTPKVKSLVIQVDVSISEEVQRMINKTVEEFTRIDVAVNCAAVPPSGKTLHLVSEEEWIRTINVNHR